MEATGALGASSRWVHRSCICKQARAVASLRRPQTTPAWQPSPCTRTPHFTLPPWSLLQHPTAQPARHARSRAARHFLRARARARAPTPTHPHTHTRTNAHTHTRANMDTHARTHAHTPPGRRLRWRSSSSIMGVTPITSTSRMPRPAGQHQGVRML